MPEIIHCAEMPWGESLVAQRGATAGMAHKRLFEGEEESPDNYMLVMSREPNTYFSPRHRHPWDQIRFCLEGKIPIAKGLFVEPGEIAYFPESAHYGPQEGGDDRIVLLLQFGGASGQGFIGPDALKQARLEMEKSGSFERGVYCCSEDGKRTNRDAYEAVWKHVKGVSPVYVEPVYKTPIVMRPKALEWQPTDKPKTTTKQIGNFPHRKLAITAIRIEQGGEFTFETSERLRRFLFVEKGSGEIEGKELGIWSAVRIQPGEEAIVRADETLEVLELAVGKVELAH
ncbi:hypothetical protein [Aurantiacibacter hainanensis]|uniref:hypothetical protein n=1 Tax=Aurantiacibacter hainanensis TaxID=3076114 RepID=UPI0030C73485